MSRLNQGVRCIDQSPLFATVVGEIEGKDAFVIGGAFKRTAGSASSLKPYRHPLNSHPSGR
jgi:hypothetical protein